jgi:hydrogenase nickel incorporation protein HypB
MFEAADAIILNKIDILPYIDFDRDVFFKGIKTLNEKAPVFEISCSTGEGLTGFIEWLRKKARDK